jgi:hypothetical protein
MFPEKPTCHDALVFKASEYLVWRPPHPEYADRAYRSCGYCGSIHPEDLLKLLAEGAKLSGSDWKYGYPHKFYMTRDQPRLFGKFYSEHFLDVGFSAEKLAELTAAIERHGGIRFEVERLSPTAPGRLKYRAPCHGFQAG